MLQLMALTIKKTITLFALVGPITMIPVFLAAVEGFALGDKQRFARTLGLSVTIALLIAAFLGTTFLDLMGISIGAMQIGGGIIVLLLAIAMVLGKETSFKGATPPANGNAGHEASIVPLAIPLLAGPAAFSYVMGNSALRLELDLVHILVPILVVGIACWITFHMAATAQRRIRQSTLDVVEKIGGFILSAIAIEMIATGLRGLFPVLVP
jgi:multiple antibiotic resistance protein